MSGYAHLSNENHDIEPPLEGSGSPEIRDSHARNASAIHYPPDTKLVSDGSDVATRQRPGRRILMNWWPEAVAVFLLVGSAIAIFATLYPYQGRPIPDWPLSITINAIVSIYILILRGSAGYLLAEGIVHQKWRWFEEKPRPLYDLAMHDEASHNPYGAARMLWRVSPRHIWHWLGGILIIAAIFIGPFSQQVVQYVDRAVPVSSNVPVASMPRSNVFVGAGRHNGAASITIKPDEQQSINAGISAPGGSVPFSCVSGNCTFPQYTTIGYCSDTVDVSSSLMIENGNWSFGTGNQTMYSPVTISTLPSGARMVWQNYTNQPNLSAMSYAPGLGNGMQWQFIIGLPGSPYDANTGEAPTGCDDATARETWRCKGHGAANLTMYPCLRTYKAEVNNGALSETLVSKTDNPGPFSVGGTGRDTSGRGVYASINATCLTSTQADLLRQAGYVINSSTAWLPYNSTGFDWVAKGFSSKPPYTNISTSEVLALENDISNRGCLYSMDLWFQIGLSQVMNTDFLGNLTGVRSNDGNEMNYLHGTQVLQTLYNYGDFSFNRTQSLFENVSTSLTNHIRTNPGSNITGMYAPALGLQYTNRTCLVVAWKWLSLPVALVILTLVYLAGALFSLGSLSHGMRTWRASPLPLLFHGPEVKVWLGQDKSNLQDIRDMERVAKGIRMRLVPDANGYMYMEAHEGRD